MKKAEGSGRNRKKSVNMRIEVVISRKKQNCTEGIAKEGGRNGGVRKNEEGSGREWKEAVINGRSQKRAERSEITRKEAQLEGSRKKP